VPSGQGRSYELNVEVPWTREPAAAAAASARRRSRRPRRGAGGADVAERKEKLDDDIGRGILDEIDEVLESNSEEYVRGFIQKGGQ
jgi:ubiquitin-like protein Pup